MRLLITTDTIGGVWTFTQELTAGLLERDCAVALVSLGRAPNASQQAWVDSIARLWPHSFQFRSLDVALEWMQENEHAYQGAAAALLSVADAFKVDVVHSNQFCFGALPVDCPRIVTAHSDVFSWAQCCRGVALDETPWLARYRTLVLQGLHGADVVVAPTLWMMNALQANFRLPQERAVIPNGRTVAYARPSQRKLQAVTAGRLWDEAKGISLLRHVASPIPLLLAGESSYSDASATLHGAGTRLQSLGVLSEADLLALFSESSIYVCPSHYEPFGVAALEAALCGCAIIANDIDSLREVWSDGALYFDGPDALSHLLQMLHADSILLHAARERSWQRAQRYSRSAMTEAYLSLFNTTRMRYKEMADVA